MKFGMDEMCRLANRLDAHHSVFYQLFEMGCPTLTTEIPTAAVTFENGENVGFLVNPNFWKKLTDTQKDFVVAHECLHVLLSHGLRMVDTDYNAKACNVAMDVVVNEMLVSKFGFNRKEIDPKGQYIWLDKVFGNKPVDYDQTFEYYFNHLEKVVISSVFGKTVDDHSRMSGGDMPQDLAERIGRRLSSEEKESLREKIEGGSKQDNDFAGTAAGSLCKVMPETRVAASHKWAMLFKRWLRARFGDETNEQWLWTNRRMTMIPDAALLPSEMEADNVEQQKLNLFLFLDTSGSCEHLAEDFWLAYQTVPKDRFNITLFGFGTRAYKVDVRKRKLHGFGGTNFRCIELEIQREMRERKIGYPDAVFIITDGHGDRVIPEKPERWHWFLTPCGSRVYVSGKSHVHKLSDYQ
jgi:predicted metal-dependent peptidase